MPCSRRWGSRDSTGRQRKSFGSVRVGHHLPMDSPIGREPDIAAGLDLSRVEAVVLEELADFQRYARCRDAEPQDLRALFVAWACLFVPETLSRKTKGTIEKVAGEIRSGPQPFADWPSRLPLDVAEYLLTEDSSTLDELRRKLGTGDGSTRGFILFCASLIANRLDVQERGFRSAGKRAFQHNYGYVERFPALLVAMKGEIKAKRDVLLEWSDAAKSKEWDCTLLENVLANSYFENPFLHDYLWLSNYAMLRLLQVQVDHGRQESLPGLLSSGAKLKGTKRHEKQAKLSSEEKTRLSEILWQRLNGHAFAGEHLHLGGRRQS